MEIHINPFPGRRNIKKSTDRHQELAYKKKIERKKRFQFVTVTASKEIIKTNPDNPPKSNTSHWVAAAGSHTATEQV